MLAPRIPSRLGLDRRLALSITRTQFAQFNTAEGQRLPNEIPGSGSSEASQTAGSEHRPMTFGRFLLYSTGFVSSVGFSYYFYQSGFNLHKTEILIGKKLAQLPFYYPPGPSVSEKNTRLPDVTISESLVGEISGWFIFQDTALKEGVRRNDVIELFGEIGLCDAETGDNTGFISLGDEEFRKGVTKTVDSFIERGRGRLTEYKRLSGVSLQETIELLDQLIGQHMTINPNIQQAVFEKLDEILAKLVDTQNQGAMPVPGLALSKPQGAVAPLDEVDISDKELLEMELGQLEKSRDELKNKTSTLSEAEQQRSRDIEMQIKELRNLISKF